jgi:hypothetical protein
LAEGVNGITMVRGNAHSLTQKIIPHLEKTNMENYILYYVPKQQGHLIIILNYV